VQGVINFGYFCINIQRALKINRIAGILGIVTLLISGSCKYVAYRKYAKGFSISFGQSGGFTGATSEYILNGKGYLSHIKEFSKDTTWLKTIEKKELKHIFKLAESKANMTTEYDKPGNMTKFIRFYKNGELIKNWQWSEGAELPSDLKELDSKLNKLL
jgi:hypothetical protein